MEIGQSKVLPDDFFLWSRMVIYNVVLNYYHQISQCHYVYKEENVYGDREVKEYIAENALMQLLESDRIKEKIRNFELDMWAY